jgi:hypothetical protein
LDGADGKFVGVGVRGGGKYLADDDVRELGKALELGGFDAEAEEREDALDFRGRGGAEVDVFFQPGKGDAHG